MPARPQPQPAVTSGETQFALFLVAQCRSPAQALPVARACAALPQAAKGLAKLAGKAGLDLSVGFGAAFWERASPGLRPAHLHTLQPIGTGALQAPATGGDVFLHVKSDRLDLTLELARRFLDQVPGQLTVLEEVHGYRYLDSRDLTGFIDGTANPRGRERAAVALIGKEDPSFAGGSYALTQRYVHDLEKWAALPQPEQEAAIGRTKPESKELKQAPPSAHIRRAELHEGGQELAILRQSLPYGLVSGAAGLFFLAYAKEPLRLEKMLARLMGASGDGAHDRLMEFTRAVSGALWFVPSLGMLRGLR